MYLTTWRVGELKSMKMKESKNVSDYITRVQTVANQLNRHGEMLPVLGSIPVVRIAQQRTRSI